MQGLLQLCKDFYWPPTNKIFLQAVEVNLYQFRMKISNNYWPLYVIYGLLQIPNDIRNKPNNCTQSFSQSFN